MWNIFGEKMQLPLIIYATFTYTRKTSVKTIEQNKTLSKHTTILVLAFSYLNITHIWRKQQKEMKTTFLDNSNILENKTWDCSIPERIPFALRSSNSNIMNKRKKIHVFRSPKEQSGVRLNSRAPWILRDESQQ